MRVIRSILTLKPLYLLAALLAFTPGNQADAAATIAVMPFDYSRKVKTNSTIVRRGPRGGTWVVTTKDSLVIELETHAFTNKLVNYLVKENKFSVIERKKLDRLIDEQKLGDAGLTDPATAAKMGKLLGADYFIMAEIAVYEADASYMYFPSLQRYKARVNFNVTIYMRVVDTTTGKVVYTERFKDGAQWQEKLVRQKVPAKISGSQIDDIQAGLSKRMVRGIVDTVFPIKVIAHKNGIAYLNRGSSGGVAVGQVFKVVEQGEALVDEDTGLVLGAEETDLAIIEVTEVQKKFSKAVVNKWLVANNGTLKKGSICRIFTGIIPKAPPPPPADTIPPSITILTPKLGATLNSNPVRVWVQVPDKDCVRVLINGVPAVQKENNRYMVVIKAAEGKNLIKAEAWDSSGNCGRANSHFVFDSTPPEVNASAMVIVKGKVDDPNSTVTVNGQPVTVKADGSYEARIQLGADRKVIIVATDEFGNSKKVVKQY
jgi:TolB-like protein